jgi:hypothetical protein
MQITFAHFALRWLKRGFDVRVPIPNSAKESRQAGLIATICRFRD